MDIREFLEARLAEDEAVALDALHSDAVKPGEWITEHREGDPPVCHIAEDRGGHYWSVAHAVFVPNAEHMARHDPARVLRDVQAKRRLLALADKIDRAREAGEAWFVPDGDDIEREMASVWSEHSDYQEAWKP